jgi:FkbM family methyltransferase
MSIETIHWHTLHPRFLGPQSRVLDLGANYGSFTRAIVERFGCICVAVEPSPKPYESIPVTDRISKHQLVVAPTPGENAFHLRENSTASSLYQKDRDQQTIMVKGVSLEQLLRDLGWDSLDLLKCDIEGTEIDVLEATGDECLRSIKQMTIEFHDFCGKVPQEKVKETLRRLDRLGFSSVQMSGVGHQDTWLINRELCKISSHEFLYIKWFLRNWFGLRRVTGRLICSKLR